MEEQKNQIEMENSEENQNTEVSPNAAENVTTSDEGSYSLEDDANAHQELDDEAEVDVEEDLSRYDALTMEQIREEAMNLLSLDCDVVKVRPAILRLRELYRKHIEELRKSAIEIDEADENIQQDALAEIDQKENEFEAIWNLYREKRKDYSDRIEKEKEDNFNKKVALLEDLKNIIDSDEPLKKTFDEFKEIQEKWREIGMVAKEKNNELWLNYNHYVGKFLEKVNMYHELRDLDMKKNLEIKLQLCEKAEALILEKSLHESFKQLQDLHRLWKETGPIPQDQRESLWERFKNASEKIRESRIAFYKELDEKYAANLEAKKALISKVRTIASGEFNSINDWNKSTKEVNELYDIWRTLGPAPKQDNEQIWSEFKGILDVFFAARKEYFSTIRQEYEDNLNKKTDICVQAESIQDSTEWAKTANELKRLQAEWKKIGPVSRAKSDIVWKRFRAACDAFFNRKNEYFSNLSKTEKENLDAKMALIEEFKNHTFGEDKKENLEVIHAFQRRWIEIGRVPFEKKDEIHNEWRKLIDSTLDSLKISHFENDNQQFKEHVDSLAGNSQGNNELSDELRKLRTKISKLEQDIHLWENNVGFFGASKNAEVLLKEFYSKIEKAKVDLKVMREKQKYLENILK